MQPLTVAEMRETLRRQGLQSLRKISDHRQPLQRVDVNVSSKRKGNVTEVESIETLKRKLRELEDERSVFLQEGVFDLVQVLCGGSSEEKKTSESSWAAQVISNVECVRDQERDKHKDRNRKLKLILEQICNSTDLTHIKDLAKVALDDLKNS